MTIQTDSIPSAEPTATERPTPSKLLRAYIADRWERDIVTIDPRTRLPRKAINPRAQLAGMYHYAGYDNGRYTISTPDEYEALWANTMLAVSMATDLQVFAARHGITRTISVRFVARPAGAEVAY